MSTGHVIRRENGRETRITRTPLEWGAAIRYAHRLNRQEPVDGPLPRYYVADAVQAAGDPNLDGYPGPESRIRNYLDANDDLDMGNDVIDTCRGEDLTASDLRDLLREVDALRAALDSTTTTTTKEA